MDNTFLSSNASIIYLILTIKSGVTAPQSFLSLNEYSNLRVIANIAVTSVYKLSKLYFSNAFLIIHFDTFSTAEIPFRPNPFKT